MYYINKYLQIYNKVMRNRNPAKQYCTGSHYTANKNACISTHTRKRDSETSVTPPVLNLFSASQKNNNLPTI